MYINYLGRQNRNNSAFYLQWIQWTGQGSNGANICDKIIAGRANEEAQRRKGGTEENEIGG